MDDLSRLEQRLESDARRVAGPPRPVDVEAVLMAVNATPSPKWRFDSMFSATKFVLAGTVMAVFGGMLLAGALPTPHGDETAPAAATESASPDATEGPLAGLVTEEIEPGVLRIISDSAGHDLDETHPSYRYDMDGIAIQPDGTVWLNASYSREDNVGHPDGPLVWSLGRPGILSLTDGIPVVGPHYLLAPADNTLLVVGDRVVRFDGEAFVPDDGPTQRRMPGGMLWLIEPDDLMGLIVEDQPRVRPRGTLAAISTGDGWQSPTDLARWVQTARANCWTSGEGVNCWDAAGNVTEYLKGTQVNQIAAAPDGSVWAVGGYDGDNGGLYRIALD